MNPTQTARAAFNPWPYCTGGFLVLFLSCVVGAGVFASRQRVDLVRPDYYEEELRFQKQFDRVQRTRGLPGELTIRVAAQARALTLGLPAEHASKSPTGTIQLYRPSDARLDRQVPLAVDAAGRQRLDASLLEPGLWKLQVNWQVDGIEYFHDASVVVPPTVGSVPARNTL